MRGRGDGSSDALDDPAEEALTDHHLDEVTEMIELAQTEERSSESPSGDNAAGLVRGS